DVQAGGNEAVAVDDESGADALLASVASELRDNDEGGAGGGGELFDGKTGRFCGGRRRGRGGRGLGCGGGTAGEPERGGKHREWQERGEGERRRHDGLYAVHRQRIQMDSWYVRTCASLGPLRRSTRRYSSQREEFHQANRCLARITRTNRIREHPCNPRNPRLTTQFIPSRRSSP